MKRSGVLAVLGGVFMLGGCVTTATVDETPGVAPFLFYTGGRAEEAMEFYVATIPNSRIVEIDRFEAGETGPEGKVEFAEFEIDGLRALCTDGQTEAPFQFTPAFSLFVTCDTEAEVDRLAEALSDGGEVMMPPDAYGWSRRFAWVADRYGVSWQLNCPEEETESS